MSSYEIAEALIAIQGVGFKPRDPITFKSGIKSPVYCDNRKFPFHPEQWAKVIHGFEQLVEEKQIPLDVVGGIEAAGIPHSAAFGFSAKKPSITSWPARVPVIVELCPAASRPMAKSMAAIWLPSTGSSRA